MFSNVMKDMSIESSDQCALLSENMASAVQLCIAQCKTSKAIFGSEQLQWLTLYEAKDIHPLVRACMRRVNLLELFRNLMTKTQILQHIRFANKIGKELGAYAHNPGTLIMCVLLNTEMWTPTQLETLGNLKEVQRFYDLLVSTTAKYNIENTKEQMSKISMILNDMSRNFPNYWDEVMVTTVLTKFPIIQETYQFAVYQQLKIVDDVFKTIRPKQDTYTLLRAMEQMWEGKCSEAFARGIMKNIGSLYRRRAKVIVGCFGSSMNPSYFKTACTLASFLYMMRSNLMSNMQESFNHIYGKEITLLFKKYFSSMYHSVINLQF